MTSCVKTGPTTAEVEAQKAAAEKAAEAAATAPAPEAPADPRPVIVCFGDSLTAGFGIEAGQTYPDVLQKLLDEQGYKYRVVNAGISGDTTQGAMDRIANVLSHKPVITLLEIGGNDGLRGLNIEKSRDNLVQITGRLEAAKSKVVMLGVTLPRNYGPDYIRAFERIQEQLAKSKSYPFMPFILQGVFNQPGAMQADGIHPSPKGAALVAKDVLPYLKPLLSK
jgi:acyl-CoA thioesterase I